MANLFGQSTKPSVSEYLATLSPSTFGTRIKSLIATVNNGTTEFGALRTSSLYKALMTKNLIKRMKNKK